MWMDVVKMIGIGRMRITITQDIIGKMRFILGTDKLAVILTVAC